MRLTINLNKPKIVNKVTNDRLGKFVNVEWKRLIDPYTPEDTGLLMGRTGNTVDLNTPWQIHYKATQTTGNAPAQSYAKYVYFSQGKSFKKPSATDHWDEKAEQAGQKEKLIKAINTALRTNKI